MVLKKKEEMGFSLLILFMLAVPWNSMVHGSKLAAFGASCHEISPLAMEE